MLIILKRISFSTHTEFVVAVTWNLTGSKFGKHVEQIPGGAEVINYTVIALPQDLWIPIHGWRCGCHGQHRGTLHTMSEGLLSTGVATACQH